ncbi:lectin C-type domain protein [Cooperia oncophora]
MEEWTKVMSLTPVNDLTWTGLEQEDDENTPLWKEPGGMNPRHIDWLVPPGDSSSNGWNSGANCVARFHTTYKSYSYFYYCGLEFYSVQQPRSRCPSGWVEYRDSCYFIEHVKMRFDKAEVRCLERGSTMFVADSMEEWTKVMSLTPVNDLTWTGLEQEDDENTPLWKEPGGMNPRHIDWLVPPGDSSSNGWNSGANCVARFHTTYKSYSYFYYCGLEFYSVCEKNSTLLTKIWDQSDRGFLF